MPFTGRVLDVKEAVLKDERGELHAAFKISVEHVVRIKHKELVLESLYLPKEAFRKAKIDAFSLRGKDVTAKENEHYGEYVKYTITWGRWPWKKSVEGIFYDFKYND
jgi:hypothetical protein